MSYWLSVIVFWEISQMFNQNGSAQGHRKFLLCPVGHGDHGKISSLIPAIIHDVHYMWVSETIQCWKSLITHALISTAGFYRYQWCGEQSSCGKVWGQGSCRDGPLSLHALTRFCTPLLLLLALLKIHMAHWQNAWEVLSHSSFSSYEEICFPVDFCPPFEAGWPRAYGQWSWGLLPPSVSYHF